MSDEVMYPHALIQRKGRWRYNIRLMLTPDREYGPALFPILMVSGWYRLGRRRAERKGRRELRRYQLKQQRDAETWTVS